LVGYPTSAVAKHRKAAKPEVTGSSESSAAKAAPPPPTFVPALAADAARALHASNPVAAATLARKLRDVLQPLRIFAEGNAEVVAVVGRLAKIASHLDGH